ncbi:hypothetical protein CPter291_3528 [Collimonas pratensis]|uniref:Uncharacterized protein n=2 Tax=Collimonas pratensis TaxID=279113 RepID=A0ABN4MD38_9BURK|nr:hypothetical protein CPter291_3528 [Collimonas pratensis]
MLLLYMRSGLMPQIAEGKKQKWKPDCASIHHLLSTIFIK